MNFIKKSYINKLSIGEIGIKKMGFWKALGIVFIIQILGDIFEIIPNLFEISIYGGSTNTWTWFGTIVNDIIIQYIIFTIVIKKIHTNENNNSKHLMNMGINKKDYIYSAGLIVSFIMIRYGVLDEALSRLPYLMSEEMIKMMESMFNDTSWGVLFVQTVIIAPIFEETIFRGIIINGMLKKYSPKKAIIVSSIIFGFIHLNLPQGLNAFVLGLLLATVYYYTRSLYICMLMHAANNFLVDFIFVPEIFMLKVSLYIIVPVLGIILFLKLKDKLDLRNRLDKFNKGEEAYLIIDSE